MKNLVLVAALVAFMIGCGNKGITKKDIVGNYDAAITIDSSVLAGQDPEAVQQAMDFMAKAKFSYVFNEDGTGSNKVQLDAMSDQKDIKWEMVAADTIKISREKEQPQLLHITRTEKGFKMDAGKGAKVELTKK
jgi:hypothetical protein